MSSQRPERVVHQDYIARIRYSNALPPPPHPPKLLEIPGTGLAGGEYTSAAYASKLAREQPLNIEADAELGMPIDLIGVPGIFEGDNRAIFTSETPQPIDPKDKQLLKPLAALGKGNALGAPVSFLRRTEYTASQAPQHFANATSKDLNRLRNDPKRRKVQSVDKEDPINILRNIAKGFDIAYPEDAFRGEDSTTTLRGAAPTDAEIKAWANPKHPTKPELKLLDSYPVLPDLDALPTSGAYIVTKFQANPFGVSETYDQRLDCGLLYPIDDPAKQAEHQRKMDEWDSNSNKPQPLIEYDYDFYAPNDPTAVRGIKRKFDANDPDHDDPSLYSEEAAAAAAGTEDGGDSETSRFFKYNRVRTYETYNQVGNPDKFYDDSIALSLHDPETDVGTVPGYLKRLAKAAYYYPIIQRTALRAKRKVGRGMLPSQLDEERIDEFNVTVGDFPEEALETLREKRGELDPSSQPQQQGSRSAAQDGGDEEATG
ncbi:Paf1 complex protein [Hortaea werneckii]|nr:Paf1 complex protein [Hortaea werneckii]